MSRPLQIFGVLVLNPPSLNSQVLPPVVVRYILYVLTVLARWYLIYLLLILIFLAPVVVYYVLYVRTILAHWYLTYHP